MYCICVSHFKCEFKMTFSILYISDVCTVYVSRISFAVILCLMKQFVK